LKGSRKEYLLHGRSLGELLRAKGGSATGIWTGGYPGHTEGGLWGNASPEHNFTVFLYTVAGLDEAYQYFD